MWTYKGTKGNRIITTNNPPSQAQQKRESEMITMSNVGEIMKRRREEDAARAQAEAESKTAAEGNEK